jgi:LysM domain
MGISSAAEAKLEASIRPEIAVMRARTAYPRRHRPSLAALPGGQSGAGQRALPAGEADAAAAADRAAVTAGEPGQAPRAPGTAGVPRTARRPGTPTAFVTATTVRTARTFRSAAHVRSQAAPSPVRLTRRGRFVLGMLAGLVVASAAALIWLAVTGQAQAASKAGAAPAGRHGMLRVVVRPGQTLWTIAAKADPSADPRLVIQQIVDDNALSGTSVDAGQVLWVPRS